MTRKALIISNPGEKGDENYCEGVNVDVQNYKNFLMSAEGGWWYESEIVCLEKPTPELLNKWLQQMKNIEYTIIVFCGHGYSYENDTIIELNKDCGYNSNSLKNGANKRIIILDCCRVVSNYLMHEKIYEYASAIKKSVIDSISARLYYDELIQKCSKGVVVAYSCDMDETAGDDSKNGGYYSYSLLQAARGFAEKSIYKSHESIVSVHNKAAESTKFKSGGTQNPQIEKPRSLPYFPFVVNI